MKSTKRSLALSFLSLILCVTMLLGTTYAWFTDEVKSGANKIVAGNLDIELEYSKDGTNWATVAEATKLFDDVALWEPGATSVVYLKLTNKGTLALKYNLAIKATGGELTNAAGVTKNLKDALKFAQVAGSELTTYATREAAVAATASTALGLENYSQANHMAANDVSYITLVVTMPTTVDNEFNYKTGTPAPTIELGIELKAYQYTSESDSFDKYYDVTAAEPIDVYDEDQFTEAVKQAKTGTVINVMKAGLELKVEYTDAKTLTIKGEKITKLTATAPNGEIHVYNEVGTVVGTVVAMNSAHLYGKVQTLDATKGHFVVEAEAEVENIQTTEAAVADTLKIDVLGTVNKLTTEKGTVEIGSTAKVQEIVATANTADALVIKVAENAEVTKISTPDTETDKSVDLQIEGKVETLDVPKVNDNIVVKVASTGVVDTLQLAEGEEKSLQVKNEGTINNAQALGGKIVEPYEAKIGEKKYASLTAAINAANDGDTVELLADATTGTSYLNITKAITLDFGKNILTSARTSYPVVALQINAAEKTVTFKGTTGGIQPNAGTGCICVKNGNLVIDGGEYKTTNAGVFSDDTGTKTLTINDGQFTETQSSGYGRMFFDFAGNITINDGTFDYTYTGSSNYVYLIEMDGVGYTCTINGGTFNVAGGPSKPYTYLVTTGSGDVINAVFNGGDVNITGGRTYLVNASDSTAVINNVDYQGVAAYFAYLANVKSLTITGGTFDSTPTTIGFGFIVTGQSDTNNIPMQGKISGGTYPYHPGAFYRGSKLEKNYDNVIAEGYKAVQNDDNTWSVVKAD